MPFWLNRIAAGGPCARPWSARPAVAVRRLPRHRGLGARSRPVGTFNMVSEPGHTTIGALLDEVRAVTGSDAELVWLEPETVEAAGVEPWTELPIWVPPTGELAGLHSLDVSAATAAGLRCRPMPQTVADTWAWLQREGLPERPTNRGGGPMDAAAEARLLELHDRTTGHAPALEA